VKGTVLYNFSMPKTEIWITRPAKRVIGEENLTDFVEALRTFLADIGATWAYVGKEGKAIRISLGFRWMTYE